MSAAAKERKVVVMVVVLLAGLLAAGIWIAMKFREPSDQPDDKRPSVPSTVSKVN
jgi:hypothetical protein